MLGCIPYSLHVDVFWGYLDGAQEIRIISNATLKHMLPSFLSVSVPNAVKSKEHTHYFQSHPVLIFTVLHCSLVHLLHIILRIKKFKILNYEHHINNHIQKFYPHTLSS